MNTTSYPAPTAGSPASSPPSHAHSVLLDALLPGFSLLSTALYSYTRIDLTLYIPLILLIAGLAFAVKYFNNYVWELLDSYFMTTAEIRVDDEIYNMVMAWVSKQGFAQRSRRFVVNVNLSSRSWYVFWASRNKEEEEEEEEVFEEGLDLHTKPKKKPQKKLQYTPACGTHFFWFKGRLVMFKRYEKRSQPFTSRSELEEVSLSTFGRDSTHLKSLLIECQTSFTKQDENKTLIYRGAFKPGTTEPTWLRCMSRVSRPFSTVVLDEGVKTSLLQDMRDYLHPHTRRWYSNRGIPYRRGYLLYGPPGSGKSSLSLAIAGYFDLKIYIISLNSLAMNEENLGILFSELPRACVVLLEDIDTAGLTHARDKPEAVDVAAAKQITAIPAGATPGVPTVNSVGGRISLSALLNVLDGVASQEGRILIMTTNHIDKLDEALIRPGRVDMRVRFGLANTAIISTIFRGIYATLEGDYPTSKKPKSAETTSLLSSRSDAAQKALQVEAAAEEKRRQAAAEDARIAALGEAFAKMIPSEEFSPADIQGYLLKYKRTADQALANAAAWVVEKREEKLKQAEKEKLAKERREREEKEKAEKEKLEKEKTEKLKIPESETVISPTSTTSRSGTSTPSSEREGDENAVMI